MLTKLPILIFISLTIHFSASAQSNLIAALNDKIIEIDSSKNLGYHIGMDALRKVLTGNKILAIGEATHGTKDFVDLRLSIIKNLIENLNYKLIVVECDYSSTLPMNEYISSGKGSAKSALKSMGFWMFDNKDFIPTIEWLKAYNQTQPEAGKIKFYGCDMQAPQIINELLDGKTVLQNPLSVNEKEGLEILLNFSKLKLSKNEIEKLVKLKAEFRLRVQESGYPETISNGLETVIQRIDHRIIGPGKDQSEFRDKVMAVNFSRIYKQNQAPNTILLAHNSHIGKRRNAPGLKVSLGGELSKAYGSSYYALGTSFYRGNVSAVDRDTKNLKAFYVEQNDKKFIEYTFNILDKTNFLLDFKSAQQNPAIFSWLRKAIPIRGIGAIFSGSKDDDENTSRVIVPYETYDGLVFLKNTNSLNSLYKN